ncbi:MAG: hypothetical protein WCK03_03405 [Candidatus Taylorbacteria bacterium]
MDDLKNDSVFVLKLILIIGGFFMVVFSKFGYYLLLLMSTAGICCLDHYIFKIPFWNHFVYSTIISTVLFEIGFPRFANFTQSTHHEVKEEYDNAKIELKRRKTIINNEQ